MFERSLKALPEEKSHEVLQSYYQHELKYGDLGSIGKLEKRLRQAAADGAKVKIKGFDWLMG